MPTSESDPKLTDLIPTRTPRDTATALCAAQAGWAVTLRYGLLVLLQSLGWAILAASALITAHILHIPESPR